MARRVNYLNNRDMLLEIHRSKSTYCEFETEEDGFFDIIVDDIAECYLPETIRTAKETKAAKLTRAIVEGWTGPAMKKSEIKKQNEVKPEDLLSEELVFRVMTFEHIPLAPGRKKTPKKEDDHYARLNFKPFKHYKFTDSTCTDLKEVGRSHCKDGEYSLEHGNITNKLAKMFLMLVNRYSQKSNWRGYCVDEDTEALTQRGWLKHNEINDKDTVLSYDKGNMKWSSIESIFRDDFNGLMFKLDSKGMDALITPGHKLVTSEGMTRVDYLLESDQVILMGDELETNFSKKYSDEFVELVGWIITEGNFQPKKGLVTVYQNEGAYADRIRSCLNKLDFRFTESVDHKTNVRFLINKKDSLKLMELLPDKNLTMNFITELTSAQRNLLIETMVDGDGWRRGARRQYNSYCQKDKDHVDLYQALCAISGQKTNAKLNDMVSYRKDTQCYTIHTFAKKTTRGECIDFHGGKSGRGPIGKGKIHHPNVPTEQYNGVVWCPKTEYGCFVARRNGKVYLTGNTYLDEMRGNALLQLSSMGLQFNEAKSDNPFAYYTASVSNSFTRVLNTEKRNQNIRDDLLVEAGKNPSFTRQIEHETQIRQMREELANKDNE